MKTKEIREMQLEQIRTKLGEAQEELLKLRFQQITGQLTDTSRLRVLRREIARMETIMGEGLRAAAKEGKA